MTERILRARQSVVMRIVACMLAVALGSVAVGVWGLVEASTAHVHWVTRERVVNVPRYHVVNRYRWLTLKTVRGNWLASSIQRCYTLANDGAGDYGRCVKTVAEALGR